jgi:hypothetical protein
VATRERERNVMQLYIRGLTWFEIARQLQLTGIGRAPAVLGSGQFCLARSAKHQELTREVASERQLQGAESWLEIDGFGSVDWVIDVRWRCTASITKRITVCHLRQNLRH